MRGLLGREAVFVLAFATVGIVAFGSFYLLADRFAHPDSLLKRMERRNPQARPQPPPTAGLPEDGSLVLRAGRTVDLGKSRVTYRGLEPGGRFRIDIVVPELDPQTTYVYHLGTEEARRGFRLGGREFRLRAASDGRVRLQAVAPAGASRP